MKHHTCYTCQKELAEDDGIKVHDVIICKECYDFSIKNIITVCKVCRQVVWTEKTPRNRIAMMRHWREFRQYETIADGSPIERQQYGEENFVRSLMADGNPTIITLLCSEKCMKEYAHQMAFEWHAEQIKEEEGVRNDIFGTIDLLGKITKEINALSVSKEKPPLAF